MTNNFPSRVQVYYWVSDQLNTTLANFSVDGSLRRYILSTLTPGTTYEFTLAAFSPQGEGPSTDPPVMVTTQSAGKSGKETASPNGRMRRIAARPHTAVDDSHTLSLFSNRQLKTSEMGRTTSLAVCNSTLSQNQIDSLNT